MRTFLAAMAVSLAILAGSVAASADLRLYPILAIERSAGTVALLDHEFTPAERRLFAAMDLQCARLPSDAPIDDYYAIASEVGGRYGLDPEQSVAFFVRSKFSEFED